MSETGVGIILHRSGSLLFKPSSALVDVTVEKRKI